MSDAKRKSQQQITAMGALKRLSVFLAVAIAGALISHFTDIGRFLTIERITQYADTLGYKGVLILAAAGMLTPLMFLPRWPIAFACGLLYGILAGTLLATASSTCGAWLHFMLSRTLLAPMTLRLMKKYKLEYLNIPKEKQFMVLFFLRAFPLSNFVATNVLAGALKMSRSRYVAASFMGMIPSSIMYAAWGKLMKKPDPHFYALALACLAVIVMGTVMAQKLVYPWLKDSGADLPGGSE